MKELLSGLPLMYATKCLRFLCLSAAIPAFVAGQNPPPKAPPVPPPATQVVTPVQPTAAEAAAAAMGKPVTNDQISNAIKQSGLDQAGIKSLLQSKGMDPSLADPFFAAQAAAQPGAGATAGQTSEFAQALVRLGLLTAGEKTEETPAPSAQAGPSRAGGIFGKDIFTRASTAFDPVTSGPVDQTYRLGIGDLLQIVVTGQVELAYQLDLRRDGTVFIPQVGQISLAGLTLDAARELLRSQMSRSYSGLSNGQARLDLSIARLRSNAVFVIGEVENPGAIQVNALATVFHALARAGGPTERGSFRNIEVRRAGKVVQRLDLYDYLLKGDAAGDIRLEQGDVVYVGLNSRVVAVVGAVRRPRIFELIEGEGFNDLLRFAGGLLPAASVDRVQIDRILPAERRAPGVERVKVDVQLKGNLDSLSRVRLLDGDIVSVFTIGDLRRNVVSIVGQVFQPGDYELRPRMTLGQLLQDAQGLMPWALPDRVKVVRLVPLTGRSELYSLDVTSDAGRTFALSEFDAVEVLDERLAYPGGAVSISGAVNRPVARPFIERESLRDAIQRSGGLREDAQLIEVSRRRTGATYSDTTSIKFRFTITPEFDRDSAMGRFLLERDDRVYVLSSPGFRAQRFVTVSGQFRYPGSYAISENQDRLRDVVRRAGDILPGAYPESFHLVRGGKLVSVDFARLLRDDPENDIGLLAGDSIVIGRDPRTVLVTGAVGRPSLIRYRQGLTVDNYIELAGGPTEKGQAGRAVVDYPSGFSKRVKRVGLFFHTSPDVTSGATITVPERPESNKSASDVWVQVLASATALSSILIAIIAVKKM